MTRQQRAARAAALKAQGLNGIQIAKRMRISRAYAYELLTDPEGVKVRARKDSYRGTCEQCGARTDGSNGSAAPKVCAECLYPRWTREDCLAACDAFFAKHHRSPRVADVDGARTLPHGPTATRLFGSWNNMLLAAGLPLNLDRYESTQREVERMLRRGKSVQEVADAFGWTRENVRNRLATRGLTPRDLGARDYRAEWQAQREYIARRYNEGATHRTIADELGCTKENVAVLIARMRKAGYDLPYRNPAAAAYRAQVAA